MIKDYIIKERLGIGASGVVYKVLKKSNNNTYVIKQIPLIGLTLQQINDAKLEARILSSVKSNYIVRYFESFEEKNNLNIVMEFCDGGDLSQFITKNKKTKYLLKEDLIWIIFLKITIGLATLHKAKILHRDLKTLNIFMTKNLGIKIGDFGVAKFLTKNVFAKTIIGTPYYLSPELCDEKPYNDKSDVWALGCILYELSTYRHPFNAKCQASLVLKILQSQPAPIHKYYSENLQKLINLLLDKNYLTRPSCYEILNLPYVIEKAKKFKLYEKIKLLYPQRKLNKKNNYNYSNRTYIKNKENNNKIYIQKTAPIKENKRNYSKIKSLRYLNSEQNYNINKEILINKNNINKYILFVSKTNNDIKKIQLFKDNRSKSSSRNNNPIKLRMKSQKINISHFDNISDINKKNKIKNISYINVNNSNIKNNEIKNIQQNQIKDINSFRSNKVYNSINEFEKILIKQNKIKKVIAINKSINKANPNSSYLNIEDNLLKNIKITDIIDNEDIDSMIQKKILKKRSDKKLINIKEFANYLNSYVSKANKSDNINNKNIIVVNNINNSNKKKSNLNSKEKLQINTEANNKENVNKIIKYNNFIMNKKQLNPINNSLEVNSNQKYYEKIVVNNIYNNKDNKNNNKIKSKISKAKINIYNNFNNININNIYDSEENNKKSNNIQEIKSNIILLYNKNKSLLNKNKIIINRINSDIYSQSSENTRNLLLHNNFEMQNMRLKNFITLDNDSNSRKKIIIRKNKTKEKKNPFKTDIYNSNKK